MRRARPEPVRDPRTHSSRWALALPVLFAASLAWKLYCLQRFSHSPLFGNLESDSATYWGWARLLVQDGWVGHAPFFLGPLYPYLLATLRPGPGSTILAPLLIQCALGAGATVLVACCARVLCRPRFALAAGALAAGCAMSTFLDLSILGESLLWFLEAVLLWLLLTAVGGPRPHRAAALSGLVIGLISLGRPSGFLLLLALGATAAARRGWPAAARSFAIASACALGICVPVLARHLALGHGPILTTYSLGYNLYVGNGSPATGAYYTEIDLASGTQTALLEGGVGGDGRAWITRTTGMHLTALESSSFWLRRTLSDVVATPLRTIRLLLWKGALALNRDEAYQLDNIHVHERIDGPLGVPGLGGFGFIGVLGLFGLAVSWRQHEGKVLAAFALIQWLTMVVFFVTDRYRHHLTLPLVVACGPALHAAWEALRSGGFSRFGWRGAALAASGALVWLPLVHFDRAQVDFSVHRVLGEALLRQHQRDKGEYQLALCIEPEMLTRLPLARSSTARAAVAGVLQSLAGSYADRGQYVRSEETLRQAVMLTPVDRDLRRDHAVASALAGMRVAALAECDTLGIPPSRLAREVVGVAERATEVDALDQAEHALLTAIAMDSTCEAANVVLLRLLCREGRASEAREQFARMRARGLPAEVLQREAVALGAR